MISVIRKMPHVEDQNISINDDETKFVNDDISECPRLINGDTWNRMCRTITDEDRRKIHEKFKDIDWEKARNNIVDK
jgi:hypothetical protein